MPHGHFSMHLFANSLSHGNLGNVWSKRFRWVQRSTLKPQWLQFYRYKHILYRQRRKWLGAFTWITGPLWQKKWAQDTINTPHSFLIPMSGLDNTETTTMIALLLLALVAHSFAVPLPSGDKDDFLLAEVRSEVSNPDIISSCAGIIHVYFLHTIMNIIQLFSFTKQKYLRRLYGLPAGLQGRQRSSSGVFQSKIKEMQKFFKLKVSSLSRFYS